MSGLKTELKDPDLKRSYYVYDAAGRLKLVELDTARTAYYEYDPSGRLLQKLLPANRVMTYYTYNAQSGRLSRLQSHDDTGALISYFAYQRNAQGTPTWIRREDGRNQYYEYDACDRLTLDLLKDASAMVYGFRYEHDLKGNRTAKYNDATTKALYYTYDARNLMAREWMVQSPGTAHYFGYDLSHRMTYMASDATTAEARYFSFDQRNQATQIRHAAGSPDPTQYFSYNGSGERVRIAEGATETYWTFDGKKLLRERRSTDAGSTSFRRYRHNKCPKDSMGSLLEAEKQDSQPQYPAFASDGTTDKLEVTVDGVVPRKVFFQHDVFGVRLGVSSTGSADTGERLQYKSGSGLIRLALTPSIYVVRARLVLADQGLVLPPLPQDEGGGIGTVGRDEVGGGVATTPADEDCPDDPRDEPPPTIYGEEISFGDYCAPASSSWWDVVGDQRFALPGLGQDALDAWPHFGKLGAMTSRRGIKGAWMSFQVQIELSDNTNAWHLCTYQQWVKSYHRWTYRRTGWRAPRNWLLGPRVMEGRVGDIGNADIAKMPAFYSTHGEPHLGEEPGGYELDADFLRGYPHAATPDMIFTIGPRRVAYHDAPGAPLLTSQMEAGAPDEGSALYAEYEFRTVVYSSDRKKREHKDFRVVLVSGLGGQGADAGIRASDPAHPPGSTPMEARLKLPPLTGVPLMGPIF